MRLEERLREVRATSTDYICVLCGSIWNSDDYDWGKCSDAPSGSIVRRCDWSCPQCGGVVVEYARHPRPVFQGESLPARPLA